jgi:hypothetical protein
LPEPNSFGSSKSPKLYVPSITLTNISPCKANLFLVQMIPQFLN